MKVSTKDNRLKLAVDYANKYFSSPDFESDILSMKKFDNANVAPEKILELFKSFSIHDRPVEVKLTYFGFFYKKVLGRTVGNGYAYVNSSGINRQLWSVSATVVHEACHIVDEFYPEASFGHGSNSSKGKQNSFPYFIDEKAENWIKKEVLKNEVKKLAMKQVVLRSLVV